MEMPYYQVWTTDWAGGGVSDASIMLQVGRASALSAPLNFPGLTCVCVLSHTRLFSTLWTLSLPGSTVHGIFQARISEWVAVTSSRGSSRVRDRICVSCLLHCRCLLNHLAVGGSPVIVSRLVSTAELVPPHHHFRVPRCSNMNGHGYINRK